VSRLVRRGFVLLIAFTVLLPFGLLQPLLAQEATPTAGTPVASATDARISVAASGIPNPRGFIWDAAGSMIVASGGIGGTAVLPADQSGAILRIKDGCPVTLASGFPSASAFGGRYGISDVAILNGTLYALGDGGFDVLPPTPAPDGLYRISADGSWQAIVNVGAWVENNPTKLTPSDQDPGGEPFAMVSDGEAFWISESNRGQLLRVKPQGAITRTADLSDPHLVPTGLKPAPDGGVYVGFLTAAPFTDGSSKVVKITADGQVTDVWTGLTSLTDVAVSPDGTLYALEMSTDNTTEPPFYRPNTGRVVRQTGPSSLEPVLTGLAQPVRMSFGPDGGLYVALPAHDAELKPGGIVRVDPAASGLTLPDGFLDTGHCAPLAPPPAATPVSTLLTPAATVAGTSTAPAATVTTTTSGTTGAGEVTIEITIRIALDQSGTAVTLPVTVMPGAAPAVGPAAPAAPDAPVAGTSPESPALGPVATASSQSAPAATGTAVTIANMAFSPATVTIPLGTTVTWTNTDPVAHTVTAAGGTFNSGHLNPGQTFTHTFNTAGTFDYQCTYHPYMKGTIVVQ
jgi:plastocyanin